MQESCSAADFASLFEQHGATETAKILGIAERRVYSRRASVERQIGRKLIPPTGLSPTSGKVHTFHSARLNVPIENGVAVVGSDAHYWPNIITPAHRAFVKFCKEFRPSTVIMNGDAFDGASISRHPPIGWEERPAVIQEMEACQERLGEIMDASPKARRIWTLGNHDARYETRLAQQAPEYAKVHGMHLKDAFPAWEPCWSVHLNEVVVKHRWKNGEHASYNNTVKAGRSIVTGHLHSLKVTPFSDYNGTRYGVDTGTLAGAPDSDPEGMAGPQFINYLEDSPVNWRAGFVVLTFWRGKLLWPEIVHVLSATEVQFQGRVHEV